MHVVSPGVEYMKVATAAQTTTPAESHRPAHVQRSKSKGSMLSRFDMSSGVHDESWNVSPFHVVYGV